MHYAYPVKWARSLITSSQLIQFMIVLTVHTYAYYKKDSHDCYDIKSVMGDIESIMVMGVEPGFAAQAFNADILQKIKYLRELNPNIQIVVDGGVNAATIGMIKEAGASAVCANSYVFKSDNIADAIKSLQ
jgi:ribulose-phosphate 3-epimerase